MVNDGTYLWNGTDFRADLPLHHAFGVVLVALEELRKWLVRRMLPDALW